MSRDEYVKKIKADRGPLISFDSPRFYEQSESSDSDVNFIFIEPAADNRTNKV